GSLSISRPVLRPDSACDAGRRARSGHAIRFDERTSPLGWVRRRPTRRPVRPPEGGGSSADRRPPRARHSVSRVDVENTVDSVPVKVLQQALETRFGSIEIQVMTETSLQTHTVDPRLAWIDLPGMHVEDRRTTVDPIHALDRPAREAVRSQSQVAAPARREIANEQTSRRHRDLEQSIAYSKREARRLGHAIVIVPHRIHAGAISIASVDQAVERPQGGPDDRKAWRAI